jgi:hypothetical protein
MCPPPCLPAGTIEYALAEDRLTEEGAIWAPDEDDITLQVRHVCVTAGIQLAKM